MNHIIADLAALAAAGYWLYQAGTAPGIFRNVPRVSDMPPGEGREEWPLVSVVITALNEEETIERAMRVRLRDDYPALEMILVDDRSTDRTGEIADMLAAEDERLEVIHLKELPEAWLGKVHAMDAGVRVAGGEWLLFSDADVFVAPGLLRRAIAYAESAGLDHLPVIPEFEKTGFLVDVVISAFARVMCVSGRVGTVTDPRNKNAVGVGSFNLVRRSALEASEGLEWLRLEVADDTTLGQMLKASGARQQVANGRGFLQVNFYPTLRSALTGSERALFTSIGAFSLLRCAAIGTGIFVFESGPLLLAMSRDRRLCRVGSALLVLQLGISAVFNRWLGRPAWHAAFAPVASIPLALMLIRAAVLGKLRGGIYWRGTFYPTTLLKPGRRFRP